MNVKDLRNELNKIIENDPALGYSEVVFECPIQQFNSPTIYRDVPVITIEFKGLADKNVVILS